MDNLATAINPAELAAWESRFEAFLRDEVLSSSDAAHDLEHTRRVVANSRALASSEGAVLPVVVPAAWLHDCITVPKHSDRRREASRLAAETAGAWLRAAGYPDRWIPEIEHAIHAHSFSAGIEPRTPEARVVQDADRLDAIGAIGIARALMLGGTLGIPLYHPEEPLPARRGPDDREYVLDHFFVKLLTLADTMQTAAGRREAERRTAFLREYLRQLEREIGGGGTGCPAPAASNG